MVLPPAGLPREEILSRLNALERDDVRWREGRAFTLAYHAGDDVAAVAEEAYRRFATENALNTDAFPSLRRIQADVVAIAGSWLGAGDEGAGFMTTGGTESILLAVKAARERGAASASSPCPTSCCPRARTPRSRRGAPTRSREQAHPGGRGLARTRARWRRRSTTAPCSWSRPHRK